MSKYRRLKQKQDRLSARRECRKDIVRLSGDAWYLDIMADLGLEEYFEDPSYDWYEDYCDAELYDQMCEDMYREESMQLTV